MLCGTSISIYGVWEGNDRDSSLQKGVLQTYILRYYTRIESLSYIKKIFKKSLFVILDFFFHPLLKDNGYFDMIKKS